MKVFSGSRGLSLHSFLGISCAGILVLFALAPDPAQAIPRYTAQYGQSCTLCHVNPTGGGMRSQYASQFLVPEEIAARGWTEEETEYLSPSLSPNITLGVDLRTLTYQREGGDGSTFAMQGDLYLDVKMSSQFSAYVEQGLSGSGEIFGLGRVAPLDGYFKAGRFIPDYGWRFSDHQMFGRRYLMQPDGTDNPASLYGSGIELGISPGMLTASASLLGGSQENGDNYAARAMINHSLGPVNLGLGASLLRRQNVDSHYRVAGGFWYVGAGAVTWLGQIDETSQEGRLGNLVSQELAYRIIRGLDLRLLYNFQDPDRALKNGTRQRYGAGLAYMPYPYFSILAMDSYWKYEEGPLVSGNDHHEGQLVIHFFY